MELAFKTKGLVAHFPQPLGQLACVFLFALGAPNTSGEECLDDFLFNRLVSILGAAKRILVDLSYQLSLNQSAQDVVELRQ